MQPSGRLAALFAAALLAGCVSGSDLELRVRNETQATASFSMWLNTTGGDEPRSLSYSGTVAPGGRWVMQVDGLADADQLELTVVTTDGQRGTHTVVPWSGRAGVDAIWATLDGNLTIASVYAD